MRCGAEFREIFNSFDKNADGVINAGEIDDVFRCYDASSSWGEENIKEFMERYDLDGKAHTHPIVYYTG